MKLLILRISPYVLIVAIFSISPKKIAKFDTREKNCAKFNTISYYKTTPDLVVWSIGHFTVVYSVTRPMNGSEAAGDLVSIQTPLFLSCKSCSCDANWPSFA